LNRRIEALDMSQIDPVTFSVLWGGLLSASQEMGVTLARTAYSNAVREGLDYSTALFDAEGNMVAQGDYSPGHLGSMAFTVRRAFQDYPKETMQPGDAILVNDPGIGSGHLPDFFMISPIHFGERLIGFAVNCAHQVDVGGMGAGSQVVDGVSDNFQEGIRFLPTRCYRAGVPERDIFRVIEANVRAPDKVIGDLRAQINANTTGARRLADLARIHGPDTLAAAMREIIVRSEQQMREAIRTIPEGVYTFQDQLDDVGPGTEPVIAKVTITVKNGAVTVDWTGSSPQREAGVNSYIHYTYAYSLASIKSVTLPMAPQNEGIIRTVKIVAPEGCFFNPKRPAPCGGRAISAQRIYEVMMGALAKAVPDRIMAAHAQMFNPNLAGIDPRTGRHFVCYEIIIGGIGGRPQKDGEEALTSPFNAANIPIEIQESNSPIIIERFALEPDSGGPGKYRGGCALRKDIRVLADHTSMYNLGDRSVTQPYGLEGGKPGRLSATILNPGSRREKVLHNKGSYRLAKNDLVSWRTAGAGGYGDPLERAVAAVQRDVMAGYVSLEAARRDYGVVIDAKTMQVDGPATEKLRARLRKNGGAKKAERAPGRTRRISVPA
jgi:N-methylhydantoinase B